MARLVALWCRRSLQVPVPIGMASGPLSLCFPTQQVNPSFHVVSNSEREGGRTPEHSPGARLSLWVCDRGCPVKGKMTGAPVWVAGWEGGSVSMGPASNAMHFLLIIILEP